MNEVLKRLGISPEIQALFNLSTELIFNYGDDVEEFGEGLHRVPTTQNLWVAGAELANHIVITYLIIFKCETRKPSFGSVFKGC